MRPTPCSWYINLLACLVLLLTGTSCAKKAATESRDVGPLAVAYYKAHPEFFHEATPADLPKDLVWEDGHDVAEFSAPEAKRGGTFHFWIDDFPRTLRPVGDDANGSFRSFFLDDNLLTLIQRQPNTGQYYPGLAKSWARSKDGKTMYFRLDPAARYSDGQPIRMSDFFFAFYFFRSPWINDPWTNNYYNEKFTGITRYDDQTLGITSADAKPDLEDRLGSVYPLPEHFYKDFGPDYQQRYQWTMEPTTGPYIVNPADIRKGASIDLTRVPNWWASDLRFYRHRFNFDRLHFEVIRDTDKAFETFRRGDLDQFSISLPPFWYDKLPDSAPEVTKGYIEKAVFYNQIPRPTYGLYINQDMPVLGNHDIREGIAYAANFDLVDAKYFRGDYVRMQTDADGYSEVPFPDIHPRPFSTEKALAHFAAAGFTQRGADGILINAQGQRLSFTVSTGYDRMKDVLTILREEAAKAGLELNLEILDGTTDWKKTQEKHHQIAFEALNVSVEKYPRYWEMYHSVNAHKPQTNNLTNTADPEMDRLITEYDHAQSMDDIRRIAHEMEVRIRDNAAFIPAFELPFYRVGYWRWIRWPADFNVRTSQNSLQYSLAWVDEDIKRETLAGRAEGKSFPSESRVYDKNK